MTNQTYRRGMLQCFKMFPDRTCSVICLFTLLCSINCFNLDTKFPVVLKGSEGSYFGYAVAFHKNKEGFLALVTAPKSNSSYITASVREPGVLMKCETHSNYSPCKEVKLEKSAGNVENSNDPEMSYHDKKDGMWLGVSLDVMKEAPHHVVVCGHLYKNQAYTGHYLVNGMCYLANENLDEKSTAKLLPLVKRSEQSIVKEGIYNYALGQAGTSATFSENDQDLLLGAPGVFDWIGTVVEYRVPNYPKNAEKPSIPKPPINLIPSPSPESYIGYSVTSGHFYQLGGMSYVAGAPRDASNIGKVYVFEKLGLSKYQIIVQHQMEGEQLGEYFGATVLGVNLDDDDYTDLIVGAPLYSLKSGGDEGRVYVYHSDGVGLELQKDIFMGSKKPGARFGSAISSLGDINQDDFKDIAIGAPYEDEGRGAIYIYHGAKTGLKPIYSQRIGAGDVNSRLKGFGISIARGMDIDSNQYPDILVGSYSSDNAVILKSHPVIHVVPRLEFDVTQIDVNQTRCKLFNKQITCFNVAACLLYSGKHVPNIMDFIVELQMDTVEEGNQLKTRGYIYVDGKNSKQIVEGISVEKDKKKCFEREVHVYDDIQDFITPMIFQMNYSLANSQHPKKEHTSFCSSCPTLDPTTVTSITKKIQFRTGCGDDNTCWADLRVRASVLGLPEDEPLILGANDSIMVNIRVENKAEPAYAASISIALPANVKVINQGHCHILVLENNNSTSSLECSLGNPLQTGVMSVFQIKLDISKLDYTIEQILIEMNAQTASEDKNPKDNLFFLKVPFKASADITIRGQAEQEQIVYKSKSEVVPVVHQYVIIKYLPSPIQSVGVAIQLPITDRATGIKLLQIEGIEVGDSRTTVPGSCNRTLTDAENNKVNLDGSGDAGKGSKDIPNTIDLGRYRAKREIQSHSLPSNFAHHNPPQGENLIKQRWYSESPGTYQLNCTSAICETLICYVGPFIDTSKVATIRIRALANITALQSAIGNKAKISIATDGRVWIRDYKYDPQPDPHRPDQDTVYTDLIIEHPVRPIENWIIWVSVVVGLLLLILILLGLLKLGFFKRQQKEEMEKMLQEGALISPKEEEPPEAEEELEKTEFDYINFANSNS